MRRVVTIIFIILTFFQVFSLEEVTFASSHNGSDAGEVMEPAGSSGALGFPCSIRGFSAFFAYSRLQFNEQESKDPPPVTDSDQKWLILCHLYFVRQFEVSSPEEWGMPSVLLPRADG